MTNKRLAILSALAATTVGFVALVLLLQREPVTHMVFISGLGDCSEGIQSDRVKSLGGDLYDYVSQANTFNKVESLPTYEAVVRENGCEGLRSNFTKDYGGDQVRVYTSDVLVDVPEAKQSWLVKYDWMPDSSKRIDLGTLTAKCPSSDKLLYGNFNCDKVLNLQKYGTPDYDPILDEVPYQGQGFNLDYDPATKQVFATIVVPTKEKNNQELIENNKAVIPYWFQKRNLDINKYSITYRVSYE